LLRVTELPASCYQADNEQFKHRHCSSRSLVSLQAVLKYHPCTRQHPNQFA